MQKMISEGKTYSFIANRLKVHRNTVSNFICRMKSEDKIYNQ
ncbi:hypothetical protein [Streptococcus uberis]